MQDQCNFAHWVSRTWSRLMSFYQDSRFLCSILFNLTIISYKKYFACERNSNYVNCQIELVQALHSLIFKNTYFEKHLEMTASGRSFWQISTVFWAIPLKIAFL